MTQTMECRGPDEEGMWISGPIALGHRRLSIIDLEGGKQPMVADHDGDRPLAALTFCGEVYNYRELRAELRTHGHTFRTNSDTEVVLRAYLQWGWTSPATSTACSPSASGTRCARSSSSSGTGWA